MLLWMILNYINQAFAKLQLSLHKALIEGLESCWLLVDYRDVFISYFNSHSDGTHSLQKSLM